MMNTIRQIIQHVDAALQAVYGGTRRAALRNAANALLLIRSKCNHVNAPPSSDNISAKL